jgi:hypothetical protein
VYNQKEYDGAMYFCVSQLTRLTSEHPELTVQGIRCSVETAIPPILQYIRKANLYIHPIKQRDGKLLQLVANHRAYFQFTGPAGIVISTYSMIGITGKRAHDAEKVMQWIRSREWGFLLLDEVHVVPANTFRKCVNGFRVHAKLGLTGELVVPCPCESKLIPSDSRS